MKRLKPVPVIAAVVGGLVLSFGVMENALAVLHSRESAPFYGVYQSTYASHPLEIVGLYQQHQKRGGGETTGVMYALVVMAGDAVEGREASFTENSASRSGTDLWRVRDTAASGAARHHGYKLEYGVDKTRQTATLAGHTFDLSRGNLFVVRLGQSVQPRVSQIQGRFSGDPGTGERALTGRFLAALAPDDPARAVLDPRRKAVPCPPEGARLHSGKSSRGAAPHLRPHPSQPSA